MPGLFTARYSMYLQMVTLFALIAISPVGEWLESTMVSHVLVQLPLLVLLGVWFAHFFPARYLKGLDAINRGGIFGCITISFIFLFWMIPRWLDASLWATGVANAKYLSLFLGGFLLRVSWPNAHFIARGVLQLEFLAMLFRLGWLYLISPDRLCNSYLLSDQIWLGRGFLAIGLALSVSWLIPLFVGGSTTAIKEATFVDPEQSKVPRYAVKSSRT